MTEKMTELIENTAKDITKMVIIEIDKVTLLGAAYDCMLEKQQDKFKNTIINQSINIINEYNFKEF